MNPKPVYMSRTPPQISGNTLSFRIVGNKPKEVTKILSYMTATGKATIRLGEG
jgi:hypothetical protein